MKKSKRILALLMCILMCVSLLPLSAFAEDDSADFTAAEEVEEIESAPADESAASLAEETEEDDVTDNDAEEEEDPEDPEDTEDTEEDAEEEEDTVIAIDGNNFPDFAFRKAVQDLFDGADSATADDFAAVTELNVSGMGIADLTGIEYFTGLEDLYCSSNLLTELDLSANTALTYVRCASNKLVDVTLPEDCYAKGGNQAPDVLLNAWDLGNGNALVDMSQYWNEIPDSNRMVSNLGNGLCVIELYQRSYDVFSMDFFLENGIYGTISLNIQPITLSAAPETVLLKMGSEKTIDITCALPKVLSDSHVTCTSEVESIGANGETENVISFDQTTGTVTANEPGTAYVTLNLTLTYAIEENGEETGEEETVKLGTTKFRVDVAESGSAVTGVTLFDTKASINLLSDESGWPTLEILPKMDQLMPTLQEEDETGDTNLVTKAEFVNATANKYFELKVIDSRTLQVVPRDGVTIKTGSYKSAIAVTIDGVEEPFTTVQILALTVTSKLPSVKVKAVKFNSYNEGATAALSFSGADVTAVEVTGTIPSWLQLSDDMKLTYIGKAGKKYSTSLKLSCTLAGYTKPAAVTLSVSAASTAPKITLKDKTITLSNMMCTKSSFFNVAPDDFDDAVAYPAILKGLTEKVGGKTVTYTVAEMQEELGISVSLGYTSSLYNSEAYSQGWKRTIFVRYAPKDPDDTAAHNYNIQFTIAGKTFSVPLTVQPTGKISYSLKAEGGLDTSVPASVINLKLTAKNSYGNEYAMSIDGHYCYLNSITVESITGQKKGEETLVYSYEEGWGPFNFDSFNYYIGLNKEEEVPSGYTWTAKVRVRYAPEVTDWYEYGDAESWDYAEDKSFNVKLTVKTPAEDKPTKATVSYKASGKMDIYGTTGIVLEPVIKNATINYDHYAYTDFVVTRVYDGAAKQKVNENVTSWFSVGNTYNYTTNTTLPRFRLNATGMDNVNAKDKFEISYKLHSTDYVWDEDTGEYIEKTIDGLTYTPYTFTLTTSAVKVSAPKTVTLRKKDVYSEVTFSMDVTTGQTLKSAGEGCALDAKSALYYTLTRNDDGTFTLRAKKSTPDGKYPTTVKISLYCTGNNTTKASTTVSLAVKRT